MTVFCKRGLAVWIFAIMTLFVNCSVNSWAKYKVADALSSNDNQAFVTDDDPELVGEAIPFTIKSYESLLAEMPDHTGLLTTVGKLYGNYAYGWIQLPADTLPDSQYKRQTAMMKRAKKFYLRGREYILRALEINHPGFRSLLDEGDVDSAIALTEKGDTTLLYLGALCWSGAFLSDKFDLSMAATMDIPVAMMNRVLELNQQYGDGAVHEFFINYYGSLPESKGGGEKKAREHFEKAVFLSDSAKASPYVSLALAVSVKTQNVEQFKELLNKAIAVDTDKNPHYRLANVLTQRKARWYLNNIGEFFLID
ncbi:MAG: TRAP transporter TatT component family protein [Fibrobacterota bacterium]